MVVARPSVSDVVGMQDIVSARTCGISAPARSNRAGGERVLPKRAATESPRVARAGVPRGTLVLCVPHLRLCFGGPRAQEIGRGDRQAGGGPMSLPITPPTSGQPGTP